MTTVGGKTQGSWRRHFYYRKEALKTTWKLRLSVLLLGVLVVWMIRVFGTVRIGESLTCIEETAHSDALLLENFDPDYLVFERAAALQSAGVASRILVPTRASRNHESTVSKGIAEVMAHVARIPNIETIPIGEVEPISFNAANQIRDFLSKEYVKSIVVVAPGFRSRRSLLVYGTLLAPAGITVRCVPVFGTTTPTNWTNTWHGIQDVGLQFLKLQYYRFSVLR